MGEGVILIVERTVVGENVHTRRKDKKKGWPVSGKLQL